LRATAGRRVRVGFAATGAPEVSALVAALRRAGERRVSVASWLLAPGVFQDRLRRSGADVVAGPLGVHRHVVDAVLGRYRGAARAVRDVA
ncbi:MAG: sirohydrochlorin chelatase, partial [Actinomycetota bacterium]|nr:sirohydrochlorin chelatase [Actinomycetota bacterium]